MSRTDASGYGSTFSPLRHGRYRVMWVGNLASYMGELIQTVGAAWMMTMLAAGPEMTALVQTSAVLPIMSFSILAGALADNLDRRRIMLVAQFLMLITSAVLTVVAFFDLLTPWLLLLFTFIIACGVALNGPAWQASMADIVPRSDLPSAVTLNSVAFNISRCVGPAIGGAIVAAAGAAAAFAINTLSYVAIIQALWRWSPQTLTSVLPSERLLGAVVAGLRHVWQSMDIRTIMVRSFIFCLSVSSVLALLPVVAKNTVGGGSSTYGVMLGCFGGGAICGGMINSRLRQVFTSETLIRLAFLGFSATACILAASPYAGLDCIFLLVAGASWVMALSLFNTIIQLSTPSRIVGRAVSIYQTVTYAGLALGSWLWGVVAHVHGVPAALMISGGTMLLGIAVGFRRPMPIMPSVCAEQ